MNWSRLKAGFQSVPMRWDFPHVTNSSSQHAKRKSGRSGGSGLFPAIKTALVDVCHRKKVWAMMILKSYGELGLGRPQGWPHEPACLVRIRTPQNSAFLSPTHTPSAGRTPRVILVDIVCWCERQRSVVRLGERLWSGLNSKTQWLQVNNMWRKSLWAQIRGPRYIRIKLGTPSISGTKYRWSSSEDEMESTLRIHSA